MIVEVGDARFRGADVYSAFRGLWWAARGKDGYSDQRGEFIVNSMAALATATVAGTADAAPEATRLSVATFMRRVETDRLTTPVHLLALGSLLGRYELTDESPRDTRTLDRASEGLRLAWWASGLDRTLLRRRG